MNLKIESLPDKERELLKTKKCLTDEVIDLIGIAYTILDSKGHICIPNAKANGKTTAWKLRVALSEKIGDPKKKWLFNPGKRNGVFGPSYWKEENPDRVWQTEGELDCLILIQNGMSAQTVTTGASTSIEPCLEHVPNNAELVLSFDNDQAGWKAMEAAVKLVLDKRPDIKLRMIHWPIEFKKGGDMADFACQCRQEQDELPDRLLKLVGNIPEDLLNKASGTQTPMEFRDLSNLPPASLADVLELTRQLGFVHDYVVEITLATYISKQLVKKNPLWLLLVGPPSSNKTELVSLLRYAPDTIAIDVMTSAPFISGMKESENPQDLLPQLDGCCFIVKDYTSFFGRSEETVKKLLSDLVSIYDGEFSKHSGSRGTIRYKATFAHVGCVTPQGLKMRQNYMNMVGPRFLTLRIPELTSEEREECLSNAWNDNFKQISIEAAKASISLVISICEHIKKHGLQLEPEEPEIKKQLNNIAQFIARTRGIVDSTTNKFVDDEGKEVVYRDVIGVQIEEPFRALHQIRTLCRSLATVRAKTGITQVEVDTIRKVALSSMPVQRAEVLRQFNFADQLTGRDVAEGITTMSTKTIKRYLEELYHLGILNREKEDQDIENSPWVYSTKEQFKTIIRDNEDDLL